MINNKKNMILFLLNFCAFIALLNIFREVASKDTFEITSGCKTLCQIGMGIAKFSSASMTSIFTSLTFSLLLAYIILMSDNEKRKK